ncbi:hypothetical protein CAEBREN_01249 [Caenorhabditis brenneri]|uniref:Uncharacterized protein n=1 Tax=Caenorhabditis brenneri TaxID=135651 RepID=G0NS49_CAEBE|nr:hypothetical protein CAEBREN_01249 [Caenorhabditis brenneri]
MENWSMINYTKKGIDHTIVSPVYNEWFHASTVARQGTSTPPIQLGQPTYADNEVDWEKTNKEYGYGNKTLFDTRFNA